MRDSNGRFTEGHFVPQEWRESWSKQFTGKILSEETKNNIRKNRPNQLRELNPNWKGGEKLTTKGYKEILIGRKRYMLEHHKVWMEQSEWGFIPNGFVVHHRNGDKIDNRIENLMCLPNDMHTQAHEHFRGGELR